MGKRQQTVEKPEFLSDTQIFEIAKEASEKVSVRPELEKVQFYYHRFAQENGFSTREEADRELYRRMYGIVPRGMGSVVKIRYWRTGRHLPAGRDDCVRFLSALNLSEREKAEVLKGWLERADVSWKKSDTGKAEYRRRLGILDGLLREFAAKLTPERADLCGISGDRAIESTRHLFCLECACYVSTLHPEFEAFVAPQPLLTVDYGSEFRRVIRLMGEIPRSVMIRFLIAFCVPQLDVKRMNELLSGLGYLPLDAEHTDREGYYSDRMLIRLLSRYEECCKDKPPAERRAWLQGACRQLDAWFAKRGLNHLRFMYFKHLETIDREVREG